MCRKNEVRSMTAQNITAAEWDRLTRRARHWMEDVQPFAITRQIEGHKYLLVDVVATQRLARSIAGDGRSEGVSVRVVPYPRKGAFAIYVWHNGSRDALDWIKTALEP
jgi:hypothetical protein